MPHCESIRPSKYVTLYKDENLNGVIRQVQ